MDKLEKIITEVAEEMGISKDLVRDVSKAQFSFVAETIKSKSMKDVRLQYLGKFGVKPGRLRHLSPQAKEEIKSKTHEFDKFL